MQISRIIQKTLMIIFCFFPVVLFAWNNSMSIGYGFSHDPNHSRYNNYGVLLAGDLVPLKRTPMTFWSVAGYLGQWHTNTPVNKNLTTFALGFNLRFYPYSLFNEYPLYLLGSLGPAFLTKDHFGYNNQGTNLTLQTLLGLGIEVNCFDINLHLTHYSNAHMASPNQGYNILYTLSIGYLF